MKNESWLEAFEYCKEACNLSLSDETAFVKKYILDECEKMVSGLEKFFEGEKFQFLVWDKTDNKNWKRIFTDVHKEAHNLVEFRGEKLSGALDFIQKIMDFQAIIEIENFIVRIEKCNNKIQPILTNEIVLIEEELTEPSRELEILKPKYEVLCEKYENFMELKRTLREHLIVNKEITFFHFEELNKRFIEQYPEYESFLPIYEENKKEYDALTAKILSLETTKANIEKYNHKIQTYFKDKAELQTA